MNEQEIEHLKNLTKRGKRGFKHEEQKLLVEAIKTLLTECEYWQAEASLEKDRIGRIRNDVEVFIRQLGLLEEEAAAKSEIHSLDGWNNSGKQTAFHSVRIALETWLKREGWDDPIRSIDETTKG